MERALNCCLINAEERANAALGTTLNTGMFHLSTEPECYLGICGDMRANGCYTKLIVTVWTTYQMVNTLISAVIRLPATLLK